eukprot:6093759-Prymnesium_polylepis.1
MASAPDLARHAPVTLACLSTFFSFHLWCTQKRATMHGVSTSSLPPASAKAAVALACSDRCSGVYGASSLSTSSLTSARAEGSSGSSPVAAGPELDAVASAALGAGVAAS